MNVFGDRECRFGYIQKRMEMEPSTGQSTLPRQRLAAFVASHSATGACQTPDHEL
jgi:hypothetical protein